MRHGVHATMNPKKKASIAFICTLLSKNAAI